jgi:DhnA family fructose-bisphosphate aldolase class Ia
MAGYEIGNYEFNLSRFFPLGLFDEITETRVTQPEIILKEARSRKRRTVLTHKGRLVILAADHPGRMVTKSGTDPIGMADRYQYLGRVLRVITHPQVDGVMATTDVIEDLFIVNHLVKKAGGPSFLDEKVILGSMNRGGLAGVEFEMEDTFTSFTAESISLLNLDGAKLMFRLDITSRDSGKTMYLSSQAINELNRREIPIFLEPLYVTPSNYKMQKTLPEMVKIIGVASAMGDSSRNLWLKIPYGENYAQIVKATTLPLLMLGGESQGNPTGVLAEFAAGIKAGANVRGALVGRNILFPGPDDPLAVALAVVDIIHGGAGAEEALARIGSNRDRDLDFLSRFFV